MSETDMLSEINGVKPKIILKDGEDREVKSQSSSSTYRVRRTMDHFYCTCPAWRNQGGKPVNGRTCKHLKELLGEKYENERLKLMNPQASPAAESTTSRKRAGKNSDEVTGPVRGKRKADSEPVAKSKGKGKANTAKRAKNDEASDDDDSDNDSLAGLSLDELEEVRNGMFDKLYKVNNRITHMKQKAKAIKEEDEDEEMADGDEDVEEEEEEEEAAPSMKLKKGKGHAGVKATISGKGKKKKASSSEDDEDDEDKEEEDEEDDDEIVEVAVVGSKQRPSLLLAEKWDLEKGLDPEGWWMSEKLDGVRAYWNGEYFMSREGNKFYAPDWFIKRFPTDVTLDGEFFAGRGTFQEIVSIVKTQGMPDKWKFKVEFCVFDVPSMADQPFEDRMSYLNKLFSKLRIKWVKVCEQTQVKSKEHLLEELKSVQDNGGEGLMLREPKSLYEGRRSKTLLKVKTFHDADAEVIGHEGGKGRNTGVCGAIKCRMIKDDGSSGLEFKVGTGLSDKVRRNPPKVGTKIIYRYFELTKSGVPRFPSYVGERAD